MQRWTWYAHSYPFTSITSSITHLGQDGAKWCVAWCVDNPSFKALHENAAAEMGQCIAADQLWGRSQNGVKRNNGSSKTKCRARNVQETETKQQLIAWYARSQDKSAAEPDISLLGCHTSWTHWVSRSTYFLSELVMALEKKNTMFCLPNTRCVSYLGVWGMGENMIIDKCLVFVLQFALVALKALYKSDKYH